MATFSSRHSAAQHVAKGGAGAPSQSPLVRGPISTSFCNRFIALGARVIQQRAIQRLITLVHLVNAALDRMKLPSSIFATYPMSINVCTSSGVAGLHFKRSALMSRRTQRSRIELSSPGLANPVVRSIKNNFPY